MKIIIYHYIREYEEKFKYFRFLKFKNFKKQLDYFDSKSKFVTKDQFKKIIKKEIKPPKNSILLTFDDGFIDHYKYAYKELKKRNIFGIFFVSVAPLEKKLFLNVHKIHLLIGKIKGKILLNQLNSIIKPKMIDKNGFKEFETKTYSFQNEHKSVINFKRMLNYFINNKYKGKILDQLLNINKIKMKVRDFYLSINHIKEMNNNGMLIGSHTFSHEVLSKLSPKKQGQEISSSIKFLSKKVGINNFITFCFPYGEKFTYNKSTLKILKKYNIKASFIVDSRKVDHRSFLFDNLEIPRYDCNEFPYGKISKIKY